MFVVMERVADERIAALIRQFTDAGLVPPEERSRFITALQLADQRSSSALAEAIILGVAYVASASGGFHSLSLFGGGSAGPQQRLFLVEWADRAPAY